MNLKLIMASAGAAAVLTFGAASASAVTVFAGPVDQTNNQGANTSQSAENGLAPGPASTTVLLDGSSSGGGISQSSHNDFHNEQAIAGAGTPADTTIALGALSQTSNQAANTGQAANNNDGSGTTLIAGGGSAGGGISQHSHNDFDNSAIIGSPTATPGAPQCSLVDPATQLLAGGTADCVTALGQTSGCVAILSGTGPVVPSNCPGGVTPPLPAAPGATSIFLGAIAQHNNQGVNTLQSAENNGGGTLIVLPCTTAGCEPSEGGPAVDQSSHNDFGNEVILGGSSI